MIYLVMFGLTTVLLHAGDRCRGVLRGILVAFGLLLPCFLAGARDLTIGTDIYSYAIWMFQNAMTADFLTFMHTQSSVAAFGWNAMTWLTANVSGSFGFYLLVIEAFCILPVYFGLKRLVPKFEWAGMLIWLLVFYAFSLNGMRQSIAVGVVFYSLIFIMNRSFFKFVICILVAMLFHQTAVIGLALYPLAWLTRKEGASVRLFGRWRGFIAVFLVASGFLFIFAFGEQIVLVFSSLKDSYSYQVQHLGSRDLSIASLYMLISCFAVWIISKGDFSGRRSMGEMASGLQSAGMVAPLGECERIHALKAASKGTVFRLTMIFSCVGNILAQMNYISDSLARLGLYGSVFVCVAGATLVANGKKSRGHALVLVAICILYFFVMIMMLGKEEVYPYSSSILGITG